MGLACLLVQALNQLQALKRVARPHLDVLRGLQSLFALTDAERLNRREGQT